MFYSMSESEMPLKCKNIHEYSQVYTYIQEIIFLSETVHRCYLKPQ